MNRDSLPKGQYADAVRMGERIFFWGRTFAEAEARANLRESAYDNLSDAAVLLERWGKIASRFPSLFSGEDKATLERVISLSKTIADRIRKSQSESAHDAPEFNLPEKGV